MGNAIGSPVQGEGKVTIETRPLPMFDQVSVTGPFDVTVCERWENPCDRVPEDLEEAEHFPCAAIAHIEAQENLLCFVELTVFGRNLVIREKRRSVLPSGRLAVKLRVHPGSIRKVESHGSGEVRLGPTTIHSKGLEVAHWGSRPIIVGSAGISSSLRKEIERLTMQEEQEIEQFKTKDGTNKLEKADTGRSLSREFAEYVETQMDIVSHVSHIDVVCAGQGDVLLPGLFARSVMIALKGCASVLTRASDDAVVDSEGSGDVFVFGTAPIAAEIRGDGNVYSQVGPRWWGENNGVRGTGGTGSPSGSCVRISGSGSFRALTGPVENVCDEMVKRKLSEALTKSCVELDNCSNIPACVYPSYAIAS